MIFRSCRDRSPAGGGGEGASMPRLVAPFPWFGGKSRVAKLVWRNFGAVANYVEPFAGSLAVLLGRPGPIGGVETVNDVDGFICNFWRATAADPGAVAAAADWPVSECDLHARHAWLVGRREDITRRLEGDPEWYDARVAGWWVWGLCCWIGSGWCSGSGPWSVVGDESGSRLLVKSASAAPGVNRQLVHLMNAGQGVNRNLIHLGDAGQGVNRKRVHLGNAGQGVNRSQLSSGLEAWMADLSARLRHVRVCCGDWSRVCSPAVLTHHGVTAVFLDPPYSRAAGRVPDLYSRDDLDVAGAVRLWALDRGEDPAVRICLAGYEGEHEMPSSWERVAWKTQGGYGNWSSVHDNPNSRRERLWFSPHCRTATRERASMPLFFGISEPEVPVS